MFKSSRIVAVAFGLVISTSGHTQEDLGQPVPEPSTTHEQPTEKPRGPQANENRPVAVPISPKLEEAGPAYANEHPRKVPDIILGDGWAQWAMAFIGLIGVAISGWAVWLLKRTLDATLDAVREGEKATVASLTAAQAATKANQIMLDDQRPWVSITPTVISSLTYEIGSNTLMLKVNIAPNNQGVRPAQNFAVSGRIKVIRKQDKTGLNSEDWIDLRKEVADSALNDSMERRMTETIFPNGKLEFSSIRYIHAHLTGLSIPEDAEVALIACVSVSYKTPSGHGGAIWHGLITPADKRGMFSDYIASAKSGPVAINFAGEPVAYY